MKEKKMKDKIKMQHIPLIVAAALCMVSVIFYIFFKDETLMFGFILLAAVIGVIPYALISYFEFMRIKDIEDRLPLFLLDISEAQKIGMTLPESLRQVSRTDYGKLTGEIKKINDQISWGIPVQDAMNNFANRMKKSKLIVRIVRIITESYSSGGDIARTMEATASDLTTIKEAEKERKSVTAEHMMVMYAIYFIFIGIVVGLSQTLVPMLNLNIQAGAAGGIMSFEDPCISCTQGILCINCLLFHGVCNVLKMGEGGACYYNALFIVMAVVQGICSGLVAGQIGEGSVIAGVKHSIIMTAAGVVSLVVLLKLM